MRRTSVALAAAAGALLAAVPVGTAAHAATTYTFAKQFDVPYTASQQGLAYAAGVHYVGFDLGSGTGRIVAYNGSGTELLRTGVLATGHTNEISVRSADGNLYVTNSTATVPAIDVVDMRLSPPAVVRTIPVSMTSGAVAGVDNAKDQIVVATGPSGGPYYLKFTSMTGTVLKKIAIPNQGITQGLEVVSGQILLYTSLSNPTRNQITVFSSSGSILQVIPVPVASEGEGLSVDSATNELYLGFNVGNRVFKMSPAFVPAVAGQAGPNLVTNPGADAATGGTSPATLVPVPGWTASAATALKYGVGGYPSATSPGPADRGANFFAGGTTAVGTLAQTIDISASASAIDTGSTFYNLDGWLGGYLSQGDNAKATVSFRNAAGTALVSGQIGPVTPTDRANVTGLLHRSFSGVVPVGARSAVVTITATRSGGTNNDGYADSLSLTLTPPA